MTKLRTVTDDELAMIVISASEVGKKGDIYKLSHAGTMNSGFSVGRAQVDLL